MTASNSAEVTPQNALKHLPPLGKDRGFYAMLGTQFLGAFNDNIFKQLVLLICIDYGKRSTGGESSGIYQPLAMFLFAFPFVVLSGLAGWLSDKHSKRTIIIASKVAEAAVMFLGMVVFFLFQPNTLGLIVMLLCVLFCMGTQSTFFGPSKYGALPEMFRGRDLPAVNGLVNMTTFLAIIFGMVLAGYSKQWYADSLWMVSGICLLIAAIGTGTSWFVRKTPVASPDLTFSKESFGFSREAWSVVTKDKQLFRILLISALFWFIGGVMTQAVNDYGKLELQKDDGPTGVLAAGMGIGIAIGCILAGYLCRGQVRFNLVTIGAWGISGSLVTVSAANHLNLSPDMVYGLSMFALISLGVFAGLYSVPLTVFLQARPPEGQKGRVIATMNVCNWIGILLSAGFYLMLNLVREAPMLEAPVSVTFFVLALLMLPVAVRFHPPDEQL